MAMYSPIRDAFKDLNELISDSRQWKERQAQAKEDTLFKQQMLTSQLEQQQFNNKMAIGEFQLRQKGDTRAADQAAFNRMNANRRWEMDKKAAGRDKAFNTARIKKMQSEQKELDFNFKRRVQNLEAQKGLLGKTTKEVFIDPVAKQTAESEALYANLNTLKAKYKTLDANNSRTTVQRALLREKVNKANAVFEASVASIKTPEAKAELWRTQATAARKLAQEWYDKENTVQGDALMEIADDYDTRAESEMDAFFKGQKNAAAAAEKDKWDTRYTRYATQYGKLDSKNNFWLSPGAVGRVTIAMKWSQKAHETGKYSPGEEFLQGLAAVDTIERNYRDQIRQNDQDYDDGLFVDRQEYIAEQELTLNEFIDKWGYDPNQ